MSEASTPLELPTVFIGSSSEGLEVARAVRDNLANDAAVTVWDEAQEFELGKSTLDGLMDAACKYDFAILVFTPDDAVTSRGADRLAPRDNVLFELGLFMGSHEGRQRTFVIHEKRSGLKIPSDFEGITLARYDRKSGNLRADLGTACNRIREQMRKHGRRINEDERHSTELGMLYRIVNAVKTEVYHDIPLTRFLGYLSRTRNPERIAAVADLIDFLQDLFSDYVYPSIPPGDLWAKSIRVYFAYYLGDGVYPDQGVNPMGCWERDTARQPFSGHFVIGLSNSEKFPEQDWLEGRAIPGYDGPRPLSNCARVFQTGAAHAIPDTQKLAGTKANYLVPNERSVYTVPVEWRTNEGTASIGVIALSSKEPKGISKEVQEKADNVAILMGSLFSLFATRSISADPEAAPSYTSTPGSFPVGISRTSTPIFARRAVSLRRQVAQYFEDHFLAENVHTFIGDRLVVASSFPDSLPFVA